MGQFSIMHLLLLFGIILLFFGGRRLPEVGSSLGRAIREFKDALDGKTSERDVTRRESLDQKQTTAPTADPVAKKEPTHQG
jgi:sec-independent protein translocase protein TatA